MLRLLSLRVANAVSCDFQLRDCLGFGFDSVFGLCDIVTGEASLCENV